MIQILGWLSTILVLVGFVLNAKQKLYLALIIWIIGDIGWIVYDILIDNYSHMTLSTIIILINSYGIFKIKGKLNNENS
jgi:hypothetical protein